ncbi:hypothetical protein LSTR_LSTR016490 [Laodelphax striatellus]|uniref:Uncharacterized protein n=1 Tax=Laodelphax striatellus TaxID=195883 RepID=A0A482XKR5_LAOST|nr:hypothetical protein LSTR_LSTR016490 [Laodelphax striatellus]
MTASSAASWDTLTQTTTKSIELAHVRRLSQEGAAPRNSTAGRRAAEPLETSTPPPSSDPQQSTSYSCLCGEAWYT